MLDVNGNYNMFVCRYLLRRLQRIATELILTEFNTTTTNISIAPAKLNQVTQLVRLFLLKHN